jgi:hypothetical protein
VSKRTHGTRAHGSCAREQHDIHIFIEHFLGALWTRIEADFCNAVGLIASKRVMLLRYLSDDAAFYEFVQAIDGIDNIDVGRETTTVEIDAMVA